MLAPVAAVERACRTRVGGARHRRAVTAAHLPPRARAAIASKLPGKVQSIALQRDPRFLRFLQIVNYIYFAAGPHIIPSITPHTHCRHLVASVEQVHQIVNTRNLLLSQSNDVDNLKPHTASIRPQLSENSCVPTTTVIALEKDT